MRRLSINYHPVSVFINYFDDMQSEFNGKVPQEVSSFLGQFSKSDFLSFLKEVSADPDKEISNRNKYINTIEFNEGDLVLIFNSNYEDILKQITLYLLLIFICYCKKEDTPRSIFEIVFPQITKNLNSKDWSELNIFLGEKLINLLISFRFEEWTSSLMFNISFFLQTTHSTTKNSLNIYGKLLTSLKPNFTDETRSIISRTLIILFMAEQEGATVNIIPFLSFIATFLKKLEKNDLILLALISKLTFTTPIPEIISVIPEYLFSNILLGDSIYQSTILEEEFCPDPQKKFHAIKKNHKSFPNGFCEIPKFNLSTIDEFEQSIPSSLETQLKSLREFIRRADQRTSEYFFNSFYKFLNQKESSQHYADLLVSFLNLYQQRPFSSLTYQMFGKFINAPIIIQKATIFNPEKVNNVILYLRSILTYIYYLTDQKIPTMLIIAYRSRPFLFIEQVIRTVSIFPDFSLANSDFINELGNVMLRLQAQETEQYSKSLSGARSTAMLIANELIKDKRVTNICLSEQKFIRSFLSLAFEEEITEAVLSTIVEAYINNSDDYIHNFAIFVMEVFSFCQTNKEREYIDVCLSFQRSVLELFLMKPEYSMAIASILDSVFDFLDYCHDEEAIKNSLLILRQFVVGSHFKLSPKFCREVAEKIRLIDNFSSSTFVYDLLIDMLSEATISNRNSLFFIINPSFIQLFLMVYGDTKQIHDILLLFMKLCEYSINNTRACHDGFLDAILLLFIKEGKEEAEVTLINSRIKMIITEEDVNQIVIPLLTKICSVKSNYNISCIISDILRSKRFNAISNMVPVFSSSITFGKENEKCCFPIGVLNPFMNISGLKSTMFSRVLSISFWINVDIEAMSQLGCAVNIISLRDENGAQFSVDLSSLSLFARFNSGECTTKTLVTTLNSKSKKWCNFTLVINTENEEECEIVCYINGKFVANSEFTRFMFSGKMTCVLGGTLREMPNFNGLITGVMGPVTLFNGPLSEDEIFEESVRNFCDPITRSYIITTTSIPYRFTRNKYNLKVDNNYFDITVFQVLANGRNLPLYTILGDVLPSIGAYFNNFDISPIDVDERILFIINQLFAFNQSAQLAFPSVIELSENLKKCPSKITYKLYREIVEIGLVITQKDLFNDWAELIIFNPNIWCLNNYETFLKVVKHWSNVGICCFRSIFEEDSKFGKMLSLYAAFFCEEYSRMPKILQGVDVSEAKRAFIIFLKRIARTNLTQKDAEQLFVFTINSSDKNKTPFLEILRDTADLIPHEVSKKYMDKIAVIPYNTLPSTVLLTTHLVHRLSGDMIHERSLGLLMHIVNNGETKVIVDMLIPTLIDYPNLIDVVCGLALITDEETMNKVSDVFSKGELEISTKGSWYIWPVLFAFNTKNYQSVVEFITKECIKSSNTTTVNDVAHFMILINENITTQCDGVLVNFFKGLLDSTDHSLRVTCAQLCAEISLFHISYNLHNDVILKLINKTYGAKYTNTCSNQNKMMLADFGDLQRLFSMETVDIEYAPRFRNDIWSDYLFAKYAQEFASIPDPLYDLSMYITDRYEEKLPSRNIQNLVALAKEKVVTSMKEYFNKEKSIFLAAMKSSTDSLMNTSLKIPTSIERDAKELINDAFEIKKEAVPEKVMKRVNSFNTCFCPFKIRQSSVHKKNSKARILLPKFKAKCLMIKLQSKKNAVFGIDEKALYIELENSLKCIAFDEVFMISNISRHSEETAIQIYTVNRKAYLLDFAPITSDQVISQLPLDKMKMLIPTQQVDPSLKSCLWSNCPMSNFDYLIHLNLQAGRSFLDSQMYPMLPPIVSNVYTAAYKCPKNQPQVARLFTEKHSSVIQELNDGAIIPEHFFLPDVFNSNELPNWCSSPFDYVYKMRKMLESDQAAPIIQKWIDAVFGSKNMQHKRIFSSSHPKKFIRQNEAKQLSYKTELGNRTIFMSAAMTSSRFGAILSDGTVIIIEYADRSGIVREVGSIDIASVKHCYGSKKYFIIITAKNIHLFSDKKTSSYSFISESSVFAALDELFLFCETKFTIRMCKYKGIDQKTKLLCYSSDIITCISGNEQFQLAVYGTVASKVHFVSMQKTTETPIIVDLQEVPYIIIVTKVWGLVVVFTKSAVHVYTCNGKFVAAAPIQYPIERASTFTTYKGFDYVLIKLRNGKILYFEAAYPDKLIDVNLKIASEFSSATFSDIIASIITIDTNGKVLSTPVND